MTSARWWALGAVVLLTLVAERFIHHDHEYWFTGIPGFFILYGFIGCVAIIYLSKWFGRIVVQRDEDYYDRHGDDDPHRALTRTRFLNPPDPGDRPPLHAPVPPREGA